MYVATIFTTNLPLLTKVLLFEPDFLINNFARMPLKFPPQNTPSHHIIHQYF